MIASSTRKKIPALSLFSGIGGLDIGAHFASFDVVAAVDTDSAALSCIDRGLGVPPVQVDLSTISANRLLKNMGSVSTQDLVLFGGPPCTAYSHAGFWLDHKRNGNDANIGRVADFIRFVKEIKPQAFLMENVPGLLFKNHLHHFLPHLEELYNKHGFSVNYSVLNCADFGVPQKRRRLFVVGIRDAQEPFEFPESVFLEADYRNTKWAFRGLRQRDNKVEPDENLGGKYAPLLPEVPPGHNYLHFTDRRGHENPLFEWRSKYWSFLYKLDPEQPSPTIPAQRISNNGPFHWENRHLRLREIARLQTFPDSYPLAPRIHARKHLGNAVPPLLSAQLFLLLAAKLGKEYSPTETAWVRKIRNVKSSFSMLTDSLAPNSLT